MTTDTVSAPPSAEELGYSTPLSLELREALARLAERERKKREKAAKKAKAKKRPKRAKLSHSTT